MQVTSALALAALAFLGHYAYETSTSQRPNILFILSDDQDLLLNSMHFMPTVNTEIGGKGVTFRNHYCTNAFCCPSRASLLAGKCVHNTNVTNNVMPFGGYKKFVRQGLVHDYLPIWLNEGGINSYYVGKFMNDYSIYNYKDSPGPGWTGSNFLLEPGVYDYLNSTWALNNGSWKSYPGENAIDVATRNALAMLDTAVNAGQPFFLTVAPAVPHVGINATNKSLYLPIPQPKWADAFPNETVPRTPNWNPSRASGASWVSNLPPLDNSSIDTLDHLYRARIRCVAGLDDMVGDLISALEKHGILDNTHIIYTTDNGFHIGQHRMGGGKKMGYETDINIPLLWRGPGVPVRNETGVSTHTDLVPTWLKLFGLPLRAQLDGRPIPVVTNQTSEASGEHVNIEFWGSSGRDEFGSNSNINRRNNTYKGLRIVAPQYSFYYSVWCTNEHELYDMSTDQYQMNNLLANTSNISTVPQTTLIGRPLQQVVARLDALMMVLKSCVETECTHPWRQLHPDGNVTSLHGALAPVYDDFYESQPKVSFSACKLGYLPEYEGPQAIMRYGGDGTWGY